MKKFVLVFLLLCAAFMSVFSNEVKTTALPAKAFLGMKEDNSTAGKSIGVMQNCLMTGFIADFEAERVGVEMFVGIPFFRDAVALLSLVSDNATEESRDKLKDLSELFSPGTMINAYFKLVNGRKFQYRLGLQADTRYFFGDHFSLLGLVGVSNGFNFNLTDRHSFNFTLTCPLALPLYLIDRENGAQHAFYYWNPSEEVDLGEIFFVMLIGNLENIFNQVCRLSFKWSI